MGCRRRKAGLLAFAVICVAPGVCGASVPQDGWPLALDVLQFIAVSNEQNDGYNRSLFPAGVSADGDGCSTRSIVLTRDSLIPVTTMPELAYLELRDDGLMPLTTTPSASVAAATMNPPGHMQKL